MADPTDDEELNGVSPESAQEGDSGEKEGSGAAGSAGSVGGMPMASDSSPPEEETESTSKKKTDSGEGDADSFGRGKAGAGATVAKLSPKKLKEVMADWRELTAQDLVDAVVEFFGEGPMRASANAIVSWTKNANAKSFAVVNWAIDAGNKAVREYIRTRDRIAGRDSRGLTQKRGAAKSPSKPGMNLGLDQGPVPSGFSG